MTVTPVNLDPNYHKDYGKRTNCALLFNNVWSVFHDLGKLAPYQIGQTRANLNSQVFASSSCLLRETTDPHAGSSKLECPSSKLTMARLKQRPRISMVPTVERNITAFDSDDGRNSDEDVFLTNKRIAHKEPFDLGRGKNVSIQTLQHIPV